MKLACISFTSSGQKISSKLQKNLKHDVIEINKETFDDKIKNHIKEIFNSYEGIIFVSSTGIAVRMIAPYVKDKTRDPAVVVVDDLGKYSISLLSGHIGGANELAVEVSNVLKALPIVTTASDGRGIDAVDVFAKRYSLKIEDMEQAKILTSMMVEGKNIKLLSEVNVTLNYPNIVEDNEDGLIIITSNEKIKYNKPICILRPKNLYLGIGCRKGKSKEEILKAVHKVFHENNLSLNSIKSIGTIDIKKDEKGIIEASRELKCDMKIFSKEDIEKVQSKFTESNFVLSNVGVTSVCEPCAYLLGGEIIVKKTALNGVTVAVSRRSENG